MMLDAVESDVLPTECSQFRIIDYQNIFVADIYRLD